MPGPIGASISRESQLLAESFEKFSQQSKSYWNLEKVAERTKLGA
jgi:hypothetical protein